MVKLGEGCVPVEFLCHDSIKRDLKILKNAEATLRARESYVSSLMAANYFRTFQMRKSMMMSYWSIKRTH